jgi:hypothetical protein
MSLSAYTAMHVVLSLAGIATGVLVLLRPAASPKAWGLTTLFLATTFAASATGLLYLLAFPRFGMGHGIGIASLIVFVPTLLALHHRMASPWRRVYVAGATALLYLNAFIAVTQAFGKIGFLRTLPATTLGSPLLLAHLLLAATCLWLGLHALGSLQPGSGTRAKRRRARPLRVADRWG